MEDKSECIFCKIAAKEVEANIVYEDDDFIAFHDIKPDSEVHIQLIPRKHIDNIDSLTGEDIDFVESLQQTGKKIIEEHVGLNNPKKLATSRFVFHVPPYNSVEHLHMHCMAGRGSFLCKFTHGNYFPWVLSVEKLIGNLRRYKKARK